MRRRTITVMAIAAAAAATQAGAQGAGVRPGYGAPPAWATAPARSRALRYRGGAGGKLPPPETAVAAVPFDARVRAAPRAGVPLRGATLPASGVRLSTRFDGRRGSRVGGAWGQRIGGGSGAVPLSNDDPRDRLESRRVRYDTPQ